MRRPPRDREFRLSLELRERPTGTYRLAHLVMRLDREVLTDPDPDRSRSVLKSELRAQAATLADRLIDRWLG